MRHGQEIDTSPLTIGRWEFSERESATGITVNDAAGRALARVPRRADDLDIARAIRALPDLLAALEEIAAQRRDGYLRGDQFKFLDGKVAAALAKSKGRA